YERNKYENNLYLVDLGLSTFELFKLIDKLQKDNRIEYAEPNFIRLIKPHTNDPLTSSQWAIENNGYMGGKVDADMDVKEAWNLSTGLGIKVAILDEGVDLSHPDLTSNILSGFDATGNNSNGAPDESKNDAHGTACAGIIAAKGNNSTGIAGVAYNAKIIPVRIAIGNGFGGWTTNDSWLANGINWAWQNGADVLSNSWSAGSSSATVTNAINNAVNNGRNGKGSVVLFSSGNNNGSVNFPSKLKNVISVGASSMCDERKTPTSCDGESWWGSNFGENLDVVAPGVQIYTTDISGSSGYASGDYVSNFNGTSSACPNAAGVIALILSINPELTGTLAREVLEKTVDKIEGYSYNNNPNQPSGTWNNQVGYGRVNAFSAVQLAQNYNGAYLESVETICFGSKTIKLLKNKDRPVVWQTSSNVSIVSQSNSAITIKAINASVNGEGWVKATLSNGIVLQEEFWIGRPKFTFQTEPHGINYVAIDMIGANGSNINDQGITSTNWGKISGTGGCFASIDGNGNGFSALVHGNCNSWRIYAKITATNACGTTTVYRSITPPAPSPCRNNYRIASKGRDTFRIIADPCVSLNKRTNYSIRNKQKQDIEVYNRYGNLVFRTHQREFNLSFFRRGIYFIKAKV
ncbi:S8 family serine peptidase, partial [Flavobacteriaceae bacterium]|nr:S8 family serine peptidase [Flavobacteriaceae bacterium]